MNDEPQVRTSDGSRSGWLPSRREVLGLGGALALGGGIAGALSWHQRHESGLRSRVFIGRADHYEADIESVLSEAFGALGITAAEIKGKRILLKPNLVETARGALHINTHPRVVAAAVETFRRFGAGEILVAEGQGHRRDSWLVLEESGMDGALADARVPFVDLNHDGFGVVPNGGGATPFATLCIPDTVRTADWVVSLPKMKTHHWAGITCAMKNMFGIMPGTVYGWPKNLLHWAGIPESIVDINKTVPTALSIVDGIVGMEGDGPIMGSPKAAGCLLVGRNAAAIDATCARVMGLNPYGVSYLTAASGRLGPIHEENIVQCGATISSVRAQFDIVDVPHLESVRGRSSGNA